MKKGRYQAARKPNRKPMWILAAILLLTIGIAIWYTLPKGEHKEAEPVAKLENRTAIPGFEELTLKANTKKQEVVLSNPQKNTCIFRISLILEDGTVLWTSKEIKPGKDSDPIKLSKALEAGLYPRSTLKYECFAMDAEKTPLNGAEIKLTLRVI